MFVRACYLVVRLLVLPPILSSQPFVFSGSGGGGVAGGGGYGGGFGGGCGGVFCDDE